MEPPLTEQLTVQLTVAFWPVSGLPLAATDTDSGNWMSTAKLHEGWDAAWEPHCWLSVLRAMVPLDVRASAVPESA
jgi:hypothetical protein